MDPFTLALATFGVQKLRGKSTKRALRDAAISCSGGSQLAGLAKQLVSILWVLSHTGIWGYSSCKVPITGSTLGSQLE
jgi:hypothetical protein